MRPMLVVTTDSLPGYDIRAILGQVVGVATRTHNPYAEGVKGLDGEYNPKASSALAHWREEAVARMAIAARNRGANAVIGMRFDHREISEYWAEVCAYGTAVVVVRLPREPLP